MMILNVNKKMAEIIEEAAGQLGDNYNKENLVEVLQFAFNRLTIYACAFLVLSILIYSLNLTKDVLILTITLALLRRKFAGVHVRSPQLCFALTVMIPVIIYYMFRDIYISNIFIICIYLVSTALLMVTGVIDNEVRRLSAEKKKKFKNQGMTLLSVMFVINIFILNEFISLAVAFIAINCLLGKANNIIKKV